MYYLQISDIFLSWIDKIKAFKMGLINSFRGCLAPETFLLELPTISLE